VDHELEVIRDQMEETRASLADKLEALESQVMGTVKSASDTVTSAVDGAKEVVSSVSEGAKEVVEKVSETVETVKESLSVSRYVERYPWASMGVAVAAGFTAAQLLPSQPCPAGDYSEALPPASSGEYLGETSARKPEAPAKEETSSWTSGLEGLWDRALGTVEGLAVGTLMSVVKDLVVNNLPQEWRSELTRTVDDFTTRLGGKVMHGHPLQELMSAFEPQQHTDNPTPKL